MDIDDFSLLNDNDLLASLDQYLKDSKSVSKGTAEAYAGNLKNLFGNLEKYFQINNDRYVNGNFLPEFYEKVDRIEVALNDVVNKGTATDDEYGDLMEKIANGEGRYSYKEAILEIDDYINDKSNDKPDGFRLILSICATRMVIEYGISNRDIIDIKGWRY